MLVGVRGSSRKVCGGMKGWLGSFGSFAMALLGGLGCTEADRPSSTSDAAVADARGHLVIELPVGISVGLGGQEPVPLPVDPLSVAPGPHVLVLASACQRVELPVDVAAGQTLVIDRARASDLEWATLRVTAKDREGKPLLHAVALGDAEVGVGQGTSETTVPACPQRVRVSSRGQGELGGFVEDIDFGKEREAERTVVLAPGPDMVRIAGGKFTLGPPEALKERWTGEDGILIFSQYPVEVRAFEIDRTEVTAVQWMACRMAGGCQRNRELWGVTRLPGDDDRPYCNVDTGKLEPVGTPGREHHPMNCVARWEAEDYCKWAGKRLPTAIEWEYAARSGDDRSLWPWGNDDPTCEHARACHDPACEKPGTVPVCSYPKGMTKQGLCDIVGNVMEYVEDVPDTRPPSQPSQHSWEGFTCMGSSWSGGPEEVIRGWPCIRHYEQEPSLGFRCARTMPKP